MLLGLSSFCLLLIGLLVGIIEVVLVFFSCLVVIGLLEE